MHSVGNEITAGRRSFRENGSLHFCLCRVPARKIRRLGEQVMSHRWHRSLLDRRTFSMSDGVSFLFDEKTHLLWSWTKDAFIFYLFPCSFNRAILLSRLLQTLIALQWHTLTWFARVALCEWIFAHLFLLSAGVCPTSERGYQICDTWFGSRLDRCSFCLC